MKIRKRAFLAAGVVATVAAFAVVFTAAASIPAGTQFLPGDNFEIDGNKPVDSSGNIDWASPPPNLVTDPDLSKSQQDNSFGQGSKEDTPVPTVVAGSIPPNKSDFSEFQEAHRVVSGDTVVYLDWTRTNVLGSADMDFELNQSNQVSSNGVTAQRTQGDVLITYDFAQGANNVSIHYATWNGNATSGSWSSLTSLNSNQAVASIADSLTFGELAINLNKAGIFSGTKCESFASGYLKSRSSDSFTSELKDFVAPKPVNITNCGSVLVSKVDFDSGAPLSGAKFSVAPGSTDSSGNTATSTNLTEYPGGLYCADNLLAGSHTVTEDQAPSGYDPPNPNSQTFSVSADSGTCASRIANSSPPDLTFKDTKQKGAIRVTKTAKVPGGGTQPLAGAEFTVDGVTRTTDALGQACWDGLIAGQKYTVTETTAPNGYAIDTASKDVTVTAGGTCSGTADGVSFSDSPLTDISVHANAQVPGASKTTIDCGSAGKTGPSDPADVSAKGLKPGVYTCTITIDP